MVSTLVRLLVFTFLCLTVSWGAIVQQKRPAYDMYGNYKPDEQHKYTGECCIVPTCDEYRRCLDSIKCDHICSTGNYRKANYGSTPGYRLKNYYEKFDCRFNECSLFKFTCSHCPNPHTYDFSIYTVRKDCSSCYDY